MLCLVHRNTDRLLSTNTEGFIPTQIESGATAAQDIRFEIRRGASVITVIWPLAAAGECAVWLRARLR